MGAVPTKKERLNTKLDMAVRCLRDAYGYLEDAECLALTEEKTQDFANELALFKIWIVDTLERDGNAHGLVRLKDMIEARV